MATQVGKILHAGGDSGDAFVIQRAPLPAIGNGIGVGAHLVRLQALQVLALAVENSHVRTEKLVGGAGQEIAIESADVDRPVRGVVDRVDVGKRALLVRQANDFLDVIDGADRVGGVADGHHPGAAADFLLQVGQIESAVVFVDLDEANGYAALLERAPGRDVGVVIEMSEQDFVAGTEFAADRRG